MFIQLLDVDSNHTGPKDSYLNKISILKLVRMEYTDPVWKN